MRRLTVALLTAGCLALGIGTLLVATGGSVTVSAQSPLHPCQQACGSADHYAFCHVDRGGEGHVICPDSSSIAQHLKLHTANAGDQCITDEFTAEDCEAIKK
jgi:hypothetical protein